MVIAARHSLIDIETRPLDLNHSPKRSPVGTGLAATGPAAYSIGLFQPT